MTNIIFTRFKSQAFTKVVRFNLRFLFFAFLVKRWLFQALCRLMFPAPVILNLFLALECVFILGILYEIFEAQK